MSIVAIYDDRQLGPVKDSNIFCTQSEMLTILSKTNHKYGGIVSLTIALEVERLVWQHWNGNVSPVCHSYQAPCKYFASHLDHVYRLQDEDPTWLNTTTNFRSGAFSQSDVEVLCKHDIVSVPLDPQLSLQQQQFRDGICVDPRFQGQNPRFLASSHAVLSQLGNLFLRLQSHSCSVSQILFSLWNFSLEIGSW